jgi:hypothetical protein
MMGSLGPVLGEQQRCLPWALCLGSSWPGVALPRSAAWSGR